MWFIFQAKAENASRKILKIRSVINLNCDYNSNHVSKNYKHMKEKKLIKFKLNLKSDFI